MKQFTISPNESGQRFDKYLKKLLSNASGSFVYKMLRKKNITLNDHKADGTEKLNAGDLVKLFLSDETFEKFSREDQTNSEYMKLKSIDSGRLQVVYEDDDVIMLADATNGFSTSSIKMWMVDKKKGEYYEIDMSGFPMNPGDIMNPGTGSTVTETLKGDYKIGSNNYPAECFVTTTTAQGHTWKSAEIYCYNGGHYPVYIVDLGQSYDMDKEGNVITVMEELRTTKVDFQAKADASLMDFNSILKKYKDGGKKTWKDLYT